MDAYIGLGSNLDDPLQHVLDAINDIKQLENSNFLQHSHIYKCNPMITDSQQPQPDYINAVARVDTSDSPMVFLKKLQQIENRHGRVRNGERWEPRVLDLDLLIFGDQIINTPELTVPHPGICERDFVLVPLSDLDAELLVPCKNRVSTLINSCKSHQLEQILVSDRLV